MRPPGLQAASQLPKEQVRRIAQTGHIRVGTGGTMAAGNEYAMMLARRREEIAADGAKLSELLRKS